MIASEFTFPANYRIHPHRDVLATIHGKYWKIGTEKWQFVQQEVNFFGVHLSIRMSQMAADTFPHMVSGEREERDESEGYIIVQ